MRLVYVQMRGGLGAFAPEDIVLVTPDPTNPLQRSTVFTGICPEGVTVDMPSIDVIAAWMVALDPDEK